jgi:hypothetical protein
MPHDKRGEELKVGDTVMVPCRVKAIHLTEEYCNVDLETKLPMPPLDSVQTFTLNSRQTIKPTATHSFAGYGGPSLPAPAWQPIETAPIEQRIIVGNREWVGEVMAGSKDEWRKWQLPPTHWMPLPSPPASPPEEPR